MVEKLQEYEGTFWRIRRMQNAVSERFRDWKDDHPEGVGGVAMNALRFRSNPSRAERTLDDYQHIYRRKTRSELVRISAAVMGIEFSYAAETAFVSPTLLKIGLEHSQMTLVWGLSPLVGFFLTPLMGSLSDRCKSRMGRRRPFILLLAFGVLAGLVLVPNGGDLGRAMGDRYSDGERYPAYPATRLTPMLGHRNVSENGSVADGESSHKWGIVFTVLGTVLLDFDADACQSPARSYLLDVTVPEDHARGLSTFTIMAGLGGTVGYALGGIDWDATSVGSIFGGHVRAVFSLVTVLFVICLASTLTAFEEIPLGLLEEMDERRFSHRAAEDSERMFRDGEEDTRRDPAERKDGNRCTCDGYVAQGSPPVEEPKGGIPSLKEYLTSIVFMPKSLRMICLTNLFSWMAHVCYSLYFTDFVGEAVFNGDPTASPGSEPYRRYEDGVRFGCWGMSMYSLACSCYSIIIERLIKRFRARRVYVGGLLCYCCGMTLMALTKNKIGIIVFSWTAGVMYSTMFTMPYLLVAHYHSTGMFELTAEGEAKLGDRARGLGTDVAIMSSMVFLAQFTLSLGMGTIVSWAGTTTAVVTVASFLSFCGAVTATRIIYFNL